MSCETHELPAVAVTQGPKHHFFGYYDKFPWDVTGRYMLVHEVDFIDREPTGDDPADICLIDTLDGNKLTRLDETFGWHFQLGSLLQWVPGQADRKIIYNQREGDRLFAVIRDIVTGETRALPRPVYHVATDGEWAITLNFARLHRTRAGYGHPGTTDLSESDLCPSGDGIWRMNLNTGECELICSLEQIHTHDTDANMAKTEQWVNHLEHNPAGTRFVFLHRVMRQNGDRMQLYTRMMTANVDGSGLHQLGNPPYNSHFAWLDDDRIVIWAKRAGEAAAHYWLHTDQTDEVTIIGEEDFDCDGHCSFSPDRKWMLTDTYPQGEKRMRTLMLYNLAEQRRVDIGQYHAPPELDGPIRCDLHPRWSRDGKKVCFDSAHEGHRQLYVVDVSPVVK